MGDSLVSLGCIVWKENVKLLAEEISLCAHGDILSLGNSEPQF